MTELSGGLRKMRVSLPQEVAEVVDYQLILGDSAENLNQYLGSKIKFDYNGAIHCIHCGRKSNKSFSQGYCYPCFKSLAQCDQCIVSPEKCHYHLGTCREPDWADEFCMQDHYVYLANSSGLKVGITRGTQIPTRWIDQGAVQALPVFRVGNRRLAGLVETVYKKHIADKTNWRAMLKGSPELLNLVAEAARLNELVSDDIVKLQQTFGLQAVNPCTGAEAIAIAYPVAEYPVKIVSQNFDKTPVVAGTLLGIKGQYLILSTGVINLRKFAGYHVDFSG